MTAMVGLCLEQLKFPVILFGFRRTRSLITLLTGLSCDDARIDYNDAVRNVTQLYFLYLSDRLDTEIGSMSVASDNPIPIGRRHRTLKEVNLLIYDYDQMVINRVGLPAHSIFHPWESYNDWRGKKVPITLGDSVSEFDWGIVSGKGYFFHWNDFFSSCELAEERGLWDAILDASGKLHSKKTGQSKNVVAKQTNASSSQQSTLIPYSELFDMDNQGRTRLFYAAERGNQSAIEKMIYRFPGTGFCPQRLGFIESKDKEGLTAADVAELNGHEEIAKLLRYQVWFMENFG